MSAEIGFDFVTGQTCYLQIRSQASGSIWNGSTFEAYSSNSGNLSSYAISTSEQGTASAHYVANMPTSIGAGVYDVTAKQKLNAWYAESDPTVANGQEQWNGTKNVPLSDLATSGAIGRLLPAPFPKGQSYNNFMFKMVSATDHVTPFTSGSITGQANLDGAGFSNLQSGSYLEQGAGWYSCLYLTSGDLNGNSVALKFTATGVSGGTADQRDFLITTQPH